MKLDRRKFLQTLLMLGVSPSVIGELPLFHSLSRYQSVLAATTPRKLALLVGINRYSAFNNSSYEDLQGCLTDVALQRDLLIGRYGFQDADILTLMNAQATRENIETAFLEHLIHQAQTGDVVIFHFSGYGTRVKVPVSSAAIAASSTVTNFQEVLGFLPSDGLDLENNRNDLLQETLEKLARSLSTDQVTMILDSSHQVPNQPFQGNLRTRSCLIPAESPSSSEMSVNTQISTLTKAMGKVNKTDLSGVILKAAQPEQVAVEFNGHGFSAGLFTYALTQYLWQIMPPRRVITVLKDTNAAIAPILGKNQQLQIRLGKKASSLIYGTLPSLSVGAEAFVEKILDSKTVEIKLTGLSPLVVNHGVINACYRVISPENRDNNEEILLQVTEQTGLKAKALVLNSDTRLSGTEFLQEAIRVIPRHLGLTIVLDSQFDRIERVDATSALSAIALVTAVVNGREQSADCVLGKKEDNYGLFTEGGRLLLRDRTDNTGAIKSAVGNLNPKLEQILAQKWWNLTNNEHSSRLGLRATLEVLQDSKAIAFLQRETGRYDFSPQVSPKTKIEADSAPNNGLIPISQGSYLQYRLENHQDQPLYFLILGIDANGKAIAWYPGDQPQQIKPQQTQIIPAPDTSVTWRASNNSGLAQMQVIAALKPFDQVLEKLADNLPNLPPDDTIHPAQILEIKNPLAIAQSLLEDLNRNSSVSSTIINNATDYYALDMKTWATLNFVYQII